MDVFEKVRETKPEIDGADENLSAARSLLMAEIRGEQRPARTRVARRPWIVAGSLVAGGAAVTAGVILGSMMSAPEPVNHANPTNRPAHSAEPTRTPAESSPTPQPLTVKGVLMGAASASAAHESPVAGPGQYLKIEHQTRHLVLWSPDEPVNATREQATAGWVADSSYTSYIPASVTDDWVDVFHAQMSVTELFGADAAAQSERWLDGVSWMQESVQRTPGGSGSSNANIAAYPMMPRDPVALLDWTRSWLGPHDGMDEDALIANSFIQELQLNAAPADLRSAMFRALSMVPGGRIDSVNDNAVTLSYLTNAEQERREAIEIDTRTGLVLRYAVTFGEGTNGAVVPDDVPDYVTVRTVTVVDDAP